MSDLETLRACAIHPADVGKGKRFKTRAQALRRLAVGEEEHFLLGGKVTAACIRGSAYHVFGRGGMVTCKQIAPDLVAVKRLEGRARPWRR
jgi:hypothetical protein